MGLFGNGFRKNISGTIRCDEKNYLIWKWKDHRENEPGGSEIYYGSSLRIKEGEVAVFVYRDDEENKVIQDFVVGPYDGELETTIIPEISEFLEVEYGDDDSFPGEVYFINMADIIQIKFAVPYFDVYDSHDVGFSVPVAVRGTLSFNIANYKNFIYIHALDNFSVQDFKEQVRDSMIRYVKGIVLNAPAENDIPLIQLERRIEEINQLVEAKIAPRFLTDFGVTVTAVDISAIEINKESAGYSLLNLREVSNANKNAAKNSSKGGNSHTPPPISEISFFVVREGKQQGPYTIKELKGMIPSGKFTKGTMVWCHGMKNWLVASEIDILREMF